MYKRNITEKLITILADTPAAFIAGPRQSGKSTLAKLLLTQGLFDEYHTLDNLNVLDAARSDPISFINNNKHKKIIIDEIQRAPELLLPIKHHIDENRAPGKFLFTGSANIMLLPEVAESLAGRMQTVNLWTLSSKEINNDPCSIIDHLFDSSDNLQKLNLLGNKKISTDEIYEFIISGGYPEILSRKNDARRDDWFEAYIDLILKRDIRDIARIEDLSKLPRLLSLLATRTCNLVNYSEIARSSSISQTTLKRYFTSLEHIFFIITLPAWSKNLSKRLVKSPKIIFSDSGLLSYLLGYNKEKLQKRDSLIGQLVENFIVMEILKQLSWGRIRPKLFHYRSHNQEEIDLILENRDGKVIAIEIKARQTIYNKDFMTIKSLQAEILGDFLAGYVIYFGEELLSFGSNIYALPIKAFF